MSIDPSTAVSLSYQEAAELVALDRPIHLPALKHLSPRIAQMLSSASQGIVLRNLQSLTVAAAEALAPHKWGLHLPELVSISRELGDALAEHIGTLQFGTALKELHSPALAKKIAKQSKWRITLDGLEAISPEIARSLAYRGQRTDLGPAVSLNGLRRLSAEAAAELVEAFPSISLHCLSDSQFMLEQGAVEQLAEADALLIDPEDAADFLCQDYPAHLLAKVMNSLHNQRDNGWPSCNFLNLSSLTSLSTTQARAICEFGGDYIDLSGLEEIGPDLARELPILRDTNREITINPKNLTDPALVSVALRGLTEGEYYWEWAAEILSPEAAAALASEEAAAALRSRLHYDLVFPRLRTLNYGVASALAATRLPLHLNGLVDLPPEVAKALAGHRGPCLAMNGLRTIDAAAASEIANYHGTLELGGITSLSPAAARALGQKISWPR